MIKTAIKNIAVFLYISPLLEPQSRLFKFTDTLKKKGEKINVEKNKSVARQG